MQDPRRRALVFLLGEHELLAAEAEEALAVAGPVLAETLARLDQAAASHNPAACAEAAHDLKGNLLNLGLAELAQTAEHACAAARQGEIAPARRAAATLRQTLATLLPG